MTTTAPLETIATYSRDFEKIRTSRGASWLTTLSEQAWSEFERLGFPTTRRGNEQWKYTDLRILDKQAFAQAPADAEIFAETIRENAPWNDDWHTAVVVNGRFVEALSKNLYGTGVAITELEQSATSEQAVVEPVFGKLAKFEASSFAALNTALFETGVLIRISDGAELARPVHVLNIITDGEDNRAFYPRTLIIAGMNSTSVVVESFLNLSTGPQFVVPVAEVSQGNGSKVSHFRVQLENDKTVHIGITRTDQPADAVFSSTSFATGPAIGRNDVHTRLAGEGAECTLHGLYITNGDSHQDNDISTTHEKPHGTSHQYYKGILAGKSRAVFSGKVLVEAGAMKTVAEQKDLNLMLSRGAEIDTKPSLEIYADDVKCAHGATAGHVDQAMLFYLQSRGVSREEAVKMLITGFASEIVDEFEPEEVRNFLYRKLEQIIPALETAGVL